MRRADRLFQIVLLLGHGRTWTARRLASEVGVSERTVYRDVRDLTLSGVPIEGEAGIGYVLRRKFQAPPLMFTRDELTALALGARMVQGWGDAELHAAAESAIAKINAAQPESVRPASGAETLLVPDFHVPPDIRRLFGELRRAVDARRKIRFAYNRADGAASRRIVRPLGQIYWGSRWTLIAWCELRQDFRMFRLDRMAKLEALPEAFAVEPGRALSDYLAQFTDEAGCD